jgi:hypothetical protein
MLATIVMLTLSHRVFLYVYAECEPGAKVSLHEYVTWYQRTGVLCCFRKRVAQKS